MLVCVCCKAEDPQSEERDEGGVFIHTRVEAGSKQASSTQTTRFKRHTTDDASIPVVLPPPWLAWRRFRLSVRVRQSRLAGSSSDLCTLLLTGRRTAVSSASDLSRLRFCSPLFIHFTTVLTRQAQKANRYFRGLVESPLERGREFPVVRVQEDTELFR